MFQVGSDNFVRAVGGQMEKNTGVKSTQSTPTQCCHQHCCHPHKSVHSAMHRCLILLLTCLNVLSNLLCSLHLTVFFCRFIQFGFIQPIQPNARLTYPRPPFHTRHHSSFQRALVLFTKNVMGVEGFSQTGRVV